VEIHTIWHHFWSEKQETGWVGEEKGKKGNSEDRQEHKSQKELTILLLIAHSHRQWVLIAQKSEGINNPPAHCPFTPAMGANHKQPILSGNNTSTLFSLAMEAYYTV
jgi:hypothetical protein